MVPADVVDQLLVHTVARIEMNPSIRKAPTMSHTFQVVDARRLLREIHAGQQHAYSATDPPIAHQTAYIAPPGSAPLRPLETT